jgi:hypothetical protein
MVAAWSQHHGLGMAWGATARVQGTRRTRPGLIIWILLISILMILIDLDPDDCVPRDLSAALSLGADAVAADDGGDGGGAGARAQRAGRGYASLVGLGNEGSRRLPAASSRGMCQGWRRSGQASTGLAAGGGGAADSTRQQRFSHAQGRGLRSARAELSTHGLLSCCHVVVMLSCCAGGAQHAWSVVP